MHQYINQFKDLDGKEVLVKGWASNIRTSKAHIFIVLRDGSGFAQCVVSLDEVGEDQFELAKRLTMESSISLEGTVRKDEKQIGGYELQVSEVEIIQVAEEYPVSKKAHGARFLADRRHLWLRSKKQWAIMRIRNEVIMSIHSFFQERGFIQMDSPIFTGNAAEGSTTLFETDFFGEEAYLAQTGQLYGEAMAMAQGLIYTFGPTFRAEKSDTPRHLAEFWMIEPEMAFYTNEMNMDLIEEMTRYIVQRVVKNSKQELEFIERDVSRLEMVSQPFPRITYNDAVKILRGEQEVNGKNAIEIQKEDLVLAEKNIGEFQEEIAKHEKDIKGGVKKGVRRFKEARILELRSLQANAEEQMRNIPKWIESASTFKHGEDFGSSDETVLTKVFDAPIMVYNWPVGIKAFYMKEADSEGKFVKGVDLLAPDGYGEIVGGSERESDLDVLLEKLKAHDLPEEVFSWYLDLRKFGSVPHSGFGLGLERMIRWICGIQHLRECIPFPRRMGRLYP